HVRGRRLLYRLRVRDAEVPDERRLRVTRVADSEHGSDRRRHLPGAAATRHADGSFAAGGGGDHRRLRARARAPDSWRRGGRVSAPETALVTAEHLSKWYGQVIGLNDVNVTVPKGITGLLGPNGAGKSTFMK